MGKNYMFILKIHIYIEKTILRWYNKNAKTKKQKEFLK